MTNCFIYTRKITAIQKKEQMITTPDMCHDLNSNMVSRGEFSYAQIGKCSNFKMRIHANLATCHDFNNTITLRSANAKVLVLITLCYNKHKQKAEISRSNHPAIPKLCIQMNTMIPTIS